MFTKSAWLHLRIPFSYFLMPVYLFSLCVSPNFTPNAMLWTFVILHLFLYPASNGYNSYFDKDEKSIGGLEKPPPVNKGLYFLALLFDAIAIVLGYIMINRTFAIMLFMYGIVSKAYSHPSFRLKKYAISGWLITGLFQGLFTVLMCYVGINNYPITSALKPQVLLAGCLATFMLLANYPMTQVYQHEEDARRGDRTISLMLGIRGTFYFVAAIFGLVGVAFILYLTNYFGSRYAYLFLVALLPVGLFFSVWFLSVLRDENAVTYKKTMWLNFVSATSLSIYFLYLFTSYSNVWQTF